MRPLAIIDLVNTMPWLWLSLGAIFSLVVGSFLNVVIHRLPIAMEQEWRHECSLLLGDNVPNTIPPNALKAISWPASHCPHCKTPLRNWHNIPLISYVLLRGKCAFCNATIHLRYPSVELITMLLGLAVAYTFGPSMASLSALVMVYFLIALSFIDLDLKLLPDQLTLPMMWLGLVVNSFGVFTSLESAFWGAVAGYLSLWLVYWAFRLATGKHGMGYGDFKLLAAIGAWLGFQAIPMVVLMSALVGIIIGVGLRLYRPNGDPEIPFGPMLALGGLAYLFYGSTIWRVFNGLMSF